MNTHVSFTSFKNISANDFSNCTSSKLNKTPPIGAPKATETPAAAAADKISLFFASFLPYLGNKYENIFPMQHAMCTIGPSLPKLKPADTERIKPTDLIISVHLPRYPRMIKPLKIVFI